MHDTATILTLVSMLKDVLRKLRKCEERLEAKDEYLRDSDRELALVRDELREARMKLNEREYVRDADEEMKEVAVVPRRPWGQSENSFGRGTAPCRE